MSPKRSPKRSLKRSSKRSSKRPSKRSPKRSSYRGDDTKQYEYNDAQKEAIQKYKEDFPGQEYPPFFDDLLASIAAPKEDHFSARKKIILEKLVFDSVEESTKETVIHILERVRALRKIIVRLHGQYNEKKMKEDEKYQKTMTDAVEKTFADILGGLKEAEQILGIGSSQVAGSSTDDPQLTLIQRVGKQSLPGSSTDYSEAVHIRTHKLPDFTSISEEDQKRRAEARKKAKERLVKDMKQFFVQDKSGKSTKRT